MTTTYIETMSALNALDFEVPGVPDYSDDFTQGSFENWLDEVLEAFEAHNGVALEGEALRAFKRNAVDYYGTFN